MSCISNNQVIFYSGVVKIVVEYVNHYNSLHRQNRIGEDFAVVNKVGESEFVVEQLLNSKYDPMIFKVGHSKYFYQITELT